MSLTAESAAPTLVVNGTRVDMIERGSGRPLLFLHPENGIEPALAAIDALAKGVRVIAPTHPGFGRSELPKGMRTIDDLSYFYLDVLDQLDLRDLTVVCVSLGAWIAAEIAVKSSARFAKLVMANAVGVKVGDRETRDIVDVFATSQRELNRLMWHDPARAPDPSTFTDEQLKIVAGNLVALSLYGWDPYLHNPKLRHRLHRTIQDR